MSRTAPSELRWCKALEARLSHAASAPNLEVLMAVKALINTPPEVMLLPEWRELLAEARLWVRRCESELPRFAKTAHLARALAAMPRPVPAWAQQEEARAMAREAQVEGGL
jgi:hypothetical protein